MRALRALYPATKRDTCIAAAKVRTNPEAHGPIFAAGLRTFCVAETKSPTLTSDKLRQLDASAFQRTSISAPAATRYSGHWAEGEVGGVERVHGEGRGGPVRSSLSFPI